MPNIPNPNINEILIFSRIKSKDVLKHRYFKSRNKGVGLCSYNNKYYVIIHDHKTGLKSIHTQSLNQSIAESAYIIAQFDIML